SIAAVLRLLLPFIGQPFGTTKRWVSREVTSMTSMLPSWSIRKGIAATCRTGSPFSALRNAFFLAAIVSSEWIVRAAPSESPAGSRLTIAKDRSPALSSDRGCRNSAAGTNIAVYLPLAAGPHDGDGGRLPLRGNVQPVLLAELLLALLVQLPLQSVFQGPQIRLILQDQAIGRRKGNVNGAGCTRVHKTQPNGQCGGAAGLAPNAVDRHGCHVNHIG